MSSNNQALIQRIHDRAQSEGIASSGPQRYLVGLDEDSWIIGTGDGRTKDAANVRWFAEGSMDEQWGMLRAAQSVDSQTLVDAADLQADCIGIYWPDLPPSVKRSMMRSQARTQQPSPLATPQESSLKSRVLKLLKDILVS